MSSTPPTGIITMVFTDIEGSSELSERFGAAFEPARSAHFRLLRGAADAHNGFEVHIAGDSIFFAFASATRALNAAIAAQTALLTHDWPVEIGPVKVRIGMHTGEPIPHTDEKGRFDYYGSPPNRAARVMSAAHGTQILLSAATCEKIFQEAGQGGIAGVTFSDIGTHRLKGVGTERLYQVVADHLPAAFPPPNVLRPDRHNLPLPVTPFLGREKEVDDLALLLSAAGRNPSATRLVTLLAFGGMGKTRTAQQVAELCAGAFDTGGVWWSDLTEARNADATSQKLAYDLGLRLQPPPSAREQIFGFLRDRPRTLLVLDNLEQAAGAEMVIRDLLAEAPNLIVFVTSRKSLNLLGETIYALNPLPQIDSLRLFVERARVRRPDFALTDANAADVEELIRRLDGSPLTIELAAARIVMMTPRQILSRLSERFLLLKSAIPDLPERQRALRAAIDWSYDLLTEEERALFAQLSVFARSGFTLEDAEAVCDSFDVFEGVFALRGHSLLASETDAAAQEERFYMLESLRHYAAEKLRDQPDARAIHERHAQRFQALAAHELAHLRTDAEGDALDRLEKMADNLQSALEWAGGETGDPSLHARLSLPRGILLQRRGFSHEAVSPIEAGLSSARQTDAPELLGRLLTERAGLRLDARETAEGRLLAQEALALFQNRGDQRGIADAENLLGQAALAEGDFAAARHHFGRSLAQRESLRLPVEAAIVRVNLGLTEIEDPNGDPAQAETFLTDALNIRRDAGDRRGVASALNNLGSLAFALQNWPDAARRYAESLEIEQELRHRFGVARALNNLGEVAEQQNQNTVALRHYIAAEHLFKEIKSPFADYTTGLLSALTAKSDVLAEEFDTMRLQVRGLSLSALRLWIDQDIAVPTQIPGTQT